MDRICQNCDDTGIDILYQAPAFDIAKANDNRYFSIGRCQYCNLVSTVDVTEADIAAVYSAEYYGSPSEKFLPIIENLLGSLARRRARKLIARWRRSSPGTATPAVLDIGCGRGILLHAFEELGARVTGLEREGFPVDDSMRDLIHTGGLSDPELARRQYDIVILWHVLEHIRNPEALLGEIACHTKENGLLIIAVPNFDSWQRKLFGPAWFHLDLPRHVIHFEPNWLRHRLENLGYQRVDLRYLEPVQAVYGFLQSALNQLWPSRLNEFYRLLKHGDHGPHRTRRLLMWLPLAGLLFPVALLEAVLAAIFRSGATLAMTMRLGK